MSADYISECPACAAHALRVDREIRWRTEPHGDGDCRSSDSAILIGKSELRFLVATYIARCRDCGHSDFKETVLRTIEEEHSVYGDERCNHCHTIWGQGAEKLEINNTTMTVCSRCKYYQ